MFTWFLVTDMALHVVQAQHGSSVIVVAAFVVLLPATAQLVLDHLKNKKREHMDGLHIRNTPCSSHPQVPSVRN